MALTYISDITNENMNTEINNEISKTASLG